MAVKTRLNSAKKRLVIAVAAGVLAAVLMFFYAGSLEARASAMQSAAIEEYGGARTEVLVATRDIMAGEELNAGNAVMMPWLADLLPAGAITDPKEAYGMALAMPVWSHEPILSVKLGGKEELIQVPDGLCAVSVPISDDMAVGGSLLPGSSVDVYAIGASQVRLVLADVLVLEASNRISSLQTGEAERSNTVLGSGMRASLKWVTLAVRDESVAELLSAARDNKLCLVLPGLNAGAALEQYYLENGEDDAALADGASEAESLSR